MHKTSMKLGFEFLKKIEGELYSHGNLVPYSTAAQAFAFKSYERDDDIILLLEEVICSERHDG